MKTLFAVDDNDVNLIAVEEALSEHYRVFTFASAEDMFKLLSKITPDLILLDIEMPGTNGFEALKKLKSDQSSMRIPVIFLTGRDDMSAELSGFELGAVDFITKPFSAPFLLKRIKIHLDVDEIVRERADNLVRLEMEKTAVEAEERMTLMLDSFPMSCQILDRNLNLLDCNNAAVKLYGLTDKQEFKNRFFEFSPEFQPDWQRSDEKMHALVDKTFKEGYSEFEWTHRRSDGTPMPTEITLVRVKYKDDNAILGYARDMREYNRMKDEIKAIEERNLVVTEASPVAYILCLKDLSPIDCNNEAIRLFACPDKQSFINNYWTRLIPETQPDGKKSIEAAQMLTDISYVDGKFKFEWQYQTYNGDKFPAEITLTPLVYKGDEYIIAFIYDLSRIKKAERELGDALIAAQAANKAKSLFLANMSHEIRTPMNAIIGITEIQLQDRTLSPDTEEALGIIFNSSNMLLGVINDILDFSKIEAGKLDLVSSKYDIPSLINDIVQLNLLRYESKLIEFKLHVDENTPLYMFGDELRTKQILNNLLSNAFKYTEKGEVCLSISAEKGPESASLDSDEHSEVTLILKVSDTGQGMTPEQIDVLFDEYMRFNNDVNFTIVGVGLGMSITKRLVDLMNGEISVESEPGKGSVFTVRLLQKYVGKDLCGADLAAQMRQSRFQSITKIQKTQFKREYMPYGSVLVVDDVESNLFVAKGLLLPYGLKIELAASGFEAIEKIKSGSVYDIIFMDHMMPQMDGIETLKIIRGMDYAHPIVALTANAISGQAEMFQANGFDGFVSKPIDSRILNSVLNSIIRNKQSPEVIEAALREAARRDKVNVRTPVTPAVSLEIMDMFIRDAQKAVAILEGYSAPDNISDVTLQLYTTTVHGMKSALANVGEARLSGVAFRLEQAGRERNADIILSETPAFLNALRSVIAKNKPPEEEYSDIQISDEDIAFLRDKLLSIKMASLTFEKKAAKDALAELKIKVWPRRIKETLDTITENLLHSAFEKVVAVTEDTIKSLE
jgi:PAS domain S-box-containing protein